ncbi:MAG: hypothetical protein NC417_01775 [Candidatus Gastranaerophilales bacterium]|nr:hypothetical protein [Candidatus Gastranaerophilales bacterium]
MEELLERLRDSAEMTSEELEEMQETLEEKDDELRTKITMARDEKLKAELETERQQVQEAIVLVETRVEEIKSREMSGLSAYREEDEREHAYHEEDVPEHAYRGEDVPEQRSLSVNPEDWFFFDTCSRAEEEGGIEAVKKLFAEASIEAEKGNADALYRLAVISSWRDRTGTLKKRRLLRKAMAQGAGGTYYDMAILLENGYFVERDVEKALAYLEKAAELGSVKAMWEMAQAYASGENPEEWRSELPEDSRKAMEYYQCYMEKAGPGGDKYLRCLTGYAACGIVIGEEKFKSVDYLKELLAPLLEAGGSHASLARNWIGDVLCEEKRFREAVSYWLEAGDYAGVKRILERYDDISNAGDGEALDRLLNEKINDAGQDEDIKCMILKWKGDRGKDDVEAFGYYCQAAGLGSKLGRDRLLKKYREGNFIDASEFFKESADAGNMDAYKYLGDLYAVDRRGNTHDYEKAMEYYRYGAKGTMKDTCEKLADEMKNLLRQENRYNRALECIASAVQERKKEGLDMIEQLAEDGYPAAAAYLKEHKPE